MMATETYRPFRTVGHLGMEIRRIRHAADLTQAELAQRAGVSRRWVSLVENGHPKAEVGHLMRVARALGLSVRFENPPTRQ